MIESASVGAGEGSARVVSRNPGSWARRYCSVSHGCGTQAGLVNRSGSWTRSLCAAPIPVWPHQIAASYTPGTVICRSATLTSLPSPALLTRHMAETRRGRAAPVGGRPGHLGSCPPESRRRGSGCRGTRARNLPRGQVSNLVGPSYHRSRAGRGRIRGGGLPVLRGLTASPAGCRRRHAGGRSGDPSRRPGNAWAHPRSPPVPRRTPQGRGWCPGHRCRVDALRRPAARPYTRRRFRPFLRAVLTVALTSERQHRVPV